MAKVLANALIAFGVALHSYTLLYGLKNSSSGNYGFSMALWLLSISPYAIAGSFVWFFRKPYAAVGALVLPSIMDAGTFYSVLINPRGSTAALALLFAPLWNLFLFLLIGALIGWWYERRAGQDAL